MSNAENVLGQTIVDFSRDGKFPEEDEVSQMLVESEALPTALSAIASARAELESEIRTISRDSAPEVDNWIKHAKSLQEDIDRSKALASEIIRQAEQGDILLKQSRAAEDYVEFLTREASYNAQVAAALQGICEVKVFLDNAQKSAVEGKILEGLHLLSDAWKAWYNIPASPQTRAMKLLNERALDLRSSIHDSFGATWKALLNVDVDGGSVTIIQKLEDDTMDLNSAITVMSSYKELDVRIKGFSEVFYNTIVRPRVDLRIGTLSSIVVEGNTIHISSHHADRTIKTLLIDLETIIFFLHNNLPEVFAQEMSKILMPLLCSKIRTTWLDSAVPADLEDMTEFRKVIALVQVFVEKIEDVKWTGVDELNDWIGNTPRIWLTKRRETSLDWTRNRLALGVGNLKQVEHVETQTISQLEEKNLTPAGNGLETHQDWDAEWSDDENHSAIPDRARRPSIRESPQNEPGYGMTNAVKDDGDVNVEDEEDDGADAWGWGDETTNEEESGADALPPPPPKEVAVSHQGSLQQAVRELTMSEKYSISSMPEPVFETITKIIEDGVTLTRESNLDNPVTAAAVGLFAIPTLVLAMYRAVSPSYYSMDPAGNMFLYNDALWLAEQLRGFSDRWLVRDDLDLRAHGKVKLEPEISAIEKFGKRAYGSEISTQRTVLSDLMGGANNFIAQELGEGDGAAAIDNVVARIRTVSAQWKPVLSNSAWAQATGSLLTGVAKKIIMDVLDLNSLGADEAFRVATLIGKVLELDDLFPYETREDLRISLVSNYVLNWLKLEFLSQVLQSDLKDIQYYWFESDLSLYFLAQEVIDLIELSFEASSRSRAAIAKIRESPFPKGVGALHG